MTSFKEPTSDPGNAQTSQPEQATPLQSVYTNTLVEVLDRLGISLVVSTYRAGKLVVIRADGNAINTHFRHFDQPTGLAVTPDRLALGTASAIWEFRNNAHTAARLSPQGKHDACYLPRNIQITGDVAIHELAWAKQELWFVNTRFSCLCTLDRDYSFVPRWRPPFVTAYDLRDRCHLNGMGMRDASPRYVTALGATDTPNGWRQHQTSGGVVIDVNTNATLLEGLCLPHSPRWYDDRLWILESGKGTLAYLDATTQQLVTLAQLPGFTRGLDFYGNLAFVGLSQIRETAVRGLPVTQTANEPVCGVWVINIHTGQTIAFLRFTTAVQEIFAVSVLPGIRFPEVIDSDRELLGTTYVLPAAALAEVVRPNTEWEVVETYFEQGNQLYNQGQLQAAIAVYRQCLQHQPSHLTARYNLGVALDDHGQTDAAQIEFEQVLRAEERYAPAYNRLGLIYSRQLRLEQALEYYRQATQIEPKFALAHYNLGLTLLQLGQFESGWQECEWRWQTEAFTPFVTPQPRWQGEPRPNQTLLIHTEQGAGDAVQFIRYLPLVAERCGRIILVCPVSLMSLFATVAGIDELLTAGEIAADAFDVYVPLMSLPHIFQTQADTIPAAIPYLTVPASAAAQAARLTERTPDQATQLHVGIAWAGSPTHTNDRQRSCSLDDFKPVLEIPNIRFYSLQVGECAQDLATLPTELQVQDLSDRLQNYSDTAAYINQLDLVISVDTSVVHLAGALGKPVWTLLCYNPDWRWLLERSDSAWYPTMRLFRQPQPEDWRSVFTEVARCLIQQFS
ncbi:MAG: TIGR03032 family protein [Cyanobacteria bacterium P01_H01_bin.121]